MPQSSHQTRSAPSRLSKLTGTTCILGVLITMEVREPYLLQSYLSHEIARCEDERELLRP